MNRPDVKHLTAEDLDALLTNEKPAALASHLATCAACAAMVAGDRRVIAALAVLPYLEPASDFSNRVMARVAVQRRPELAIDRATPRAVSARRRAIAAALVTGGAFAAGFGWAVAHPAAAVGWSAPALRDAGHALWLSLQTVAANATEQPWFATVRDTFATPARALLFLGGGALAYAIGLTGLRRLMAEPAPNAGW